jgi:hypothetical protein
MRAPSRFLLTANYYQLRSKMIAQWAGVRQVTVRILIRLFPTLAFTGTNVKDVMSNRLDDSAFVPDDRQAFALRSATETGLLDPVDPCGRT